MNKKIVDKIIKLISLSENNSNQAEAEVAKEKAIELMTQYEISLSEIESEKSEIKTDIRETTAKRLVKYDTMLMSYISDFNGIAFLTLQGLGNRKARHYFIGKETDIQLNDYMIDAVINQRTMSWKRYLVKFKNNHFGGSPKLIVRQTWMKSYALGLLEKLESLKEKRNEKLSEYGIVPVDRAAQALYEYEKMNNKVKEGRRSRMKSFNMDGFNSGKQASINKGLKNNVLRIEK